MKGIIIGGPTGVGKTDLSIKLAQILKTEIISSDSAQVFSGLDIGTGKITLKEKQNIPHHLIDILPPNKKYSVGDFQKDSDKILKSFENNSIPPIIVGGTGLYLKAIADGLASLPPADLNLRNSFESLSTEEIFSKLELLDLNASKSIHKNNRVKLERALEVCLLTKNKFSTLSTQNIKNHNFTFLKIVLIRDRTTLYQRIERRVDTMVADGLLQEVQSLYNIYGENLKQLNIIGYSEIIDFINGVCTFEEAIDKVKQNSRHYCKRQITWFKTSEEYLWYNLDEMSEEDILKDILNKFNFLL